MNPSPIGPEQLAGLKCLHRFEEQERRLFLEFVEPVCIEQNTVLFQEGDSGDFMYLIVSGQVRIFSRRKGADVTLSWLDAGDAFGDLALFHHSPRLASAEAVAGSLLLKLTAASLESFTARHSDLAAKFLYSLAASLSQMYKDFR